MESNAHFISPAEAISDLRRLVEDRFDEDSPIQKDLLKAIDVVTVTFKSSCNEADRRLEEVRYQCMEELQDHIDDLTEEIAQCKEDSAADRVTIQHLVAVVAKLVKSVGGRYDSHRRDSRASDSEEFALAVR